MANRDEMSFSRAFADARRELGAGKTFTWRGDRYTTNYAEEERSSPSRSPRPQQRPSSPSRSPRPQQRPSRAPEESPRPTPRSRPSVERDARDASPTRSATTAPPASVQRVIDEANNASQRRVAERIAEEGAQKRVPGRAIIQAIRNAFRGEGPTNPAEVMRQGANSRSPDSESSGSRTRGRRAGTGTAMAKGGMVKKGNTDRRGKGMFYKSESPRGYK